MDAGNLLRADGGCADAVPRALLYSRDVRYAPTDGGATDSGARPGPGLDKDRGPKTRVRSGADRRDVQLARKKKRGPTSAAGGRTPRHSLAGRVSRPLGRLLLHARGDVNTRPGGDGDARAASARGFEREVADRDTHIGVDKANA